MNSVVEKLAAIEKEVAAIQPKMLPLTERIADLDQKVAGFAEQLTGIAEESAAVKQDIELTRQSLTRIQTLIGESRAESEQLVAGQEENLQRCETMTAVFGEAFQAVSKFFETAQRMGLADQAKAVFLDTPAMPPVPPVSVSAPVVMTTPPAPHPHVVSPSAVPSELKRVWNRLPTIPEPVVNEMASSPISEQPEPILTAPVIETPPETEMLTPEPPVEPSDAESASETPPETEMLTPEPPVEPSGEESVNVAPPEPEMLPDGDVSEIVPAENESESMIPEPPAMEMPPVESPASELPEESILSDSDFDSALSDAGKPGLDSWSVPGLPDVAVPPEIVQTDFDATDSGQGTDAEPSNDLASHLDVPPLNLATPALPEQEKPADESDDQAIEDLLATMAIPVTAAAGG